MKWRSAREERTREEVSHRSGEWSREPKTINLGNGVKTAGRESFRGSESMICSERKACRKVKQKKEEMRQRQRRKIMAEMTGKIKSEGRVDANNSWWVSELLAVDCKKAWFHPEWEGTVRRWHHWLCEMKKNDEVKWMEMEHQKVAVKSYDLEKSPNHWCGEEECRF